MDPPVVDALLDVLGPFVFPIVLFAAGAVGYGLLLALGRLLEPVPDETSEWRTAGDEAGGRGRTGGTGERGDEPAGSDRREC